MTRNEAHQAYRSVLSAAPSMADRRQAYRRLCQRDLFFLLYYGLHRVDLDRDWLFDRCREVQADPDGFLDLWAREHYKSTIITFGLTIQDILNDPEVTFGIFSVTRPIAKAFLRQIKQEFEQNDELKQAFPDILWGNPEREAPKWSEDDGIVVKRQSNPKESTVEAWGLVDSMPTSKHFKKRVYDDVVTEKSVTSPEMITKTTERWELSLNLGAEGQETPGGVDRYVGTRYHYNDTYAVILERGAAIPRLHPGTSNGKPDGRPVLWSPATLADKRRKMGPYTFSCQILQDPKAEDTMGFMKEWLRYWPAAKYGGMNLYVIVDPASGKKKSDYSVFTVVGRARDENYYVVRWIRDRFTLTQRADVLFYLVKTFRPLMTYYEEYGMQADIQHFEDRMEKENYRFVIQAVKGAVAKEDRIRGLIPVFEQGNLYIPESCIYVNQEGVTQDLTKIFVNDEYVPFPFVRGHDDMLDSLARIKDPEVTMAVPDWSVVPFDIQDEGRLGAYHPGSRQPVADDGGSYNPLTHGLGAGR